MLDLTALRDTIHAFDRDANLPDTDIRGHGDFTLWMQALENNEILFSGGINRVRYESFLDIDFTGPEINNQEWRAQLNRYAWLPPLADAYSRTKDERWARLAHDSIKAWMDYRSYTGHETVADVWPSTGDNTLSTSLRLGQRDLHGWWGTLPYFEGSPYFNDDFIARMEASTYEQLHFLYQNNRKVGNFRISELDTFMFLSEILPGAKQYREYAVLCLNETFRSQMGPDGSHMEHTAGYHNWMCEVFTRYALLSLRRPDIGLAIDPGRLLDAWEYTLANYTPDGRGWGIGDSIRWHPDAEPADMASVFDKVDALRREFSYPPHSRTIKNAFPFAGQYFMRDTNTAFVFDATNFGGWHCHPARGSILCYHGDRLQLADPGSLNYERSDPFMAPGRGTPMHNTITVNNWLQQPQANATVPVFLDDEAVALLQCVYPGGYTNSRPGMTTALRPEDIRSVAGRHVRTFFWKKGSFAVVFDTLDVLAPEYEYAAHWQFREEDVRFDQHARLMHTQSDTYNIAVAAVHAEHAVKAVQYRGDFDRMLGYVTRGNSMLSGGEPAPMLSLEGYMSGATKTRLCHVILPFEGAHPPHIGASSEMVDDVLHTAITVGEETLRFAANIQFIDGEYGKTLIGFKGPLQSDGYFAVRGEDGFSWGYNATMIR